MNAIMLPASPLVRGEALPEVLQLSREAEIAMQGACRLRQVMGRMRTVEGRKLTAVDNRIGELMCRLQKANPGRIREAMAASGELYRLKQHRRRVARGERKEAGTQ